MIFTLRIQLKAPPFDSYTRTSVGHQFVELNAHGTKGGKKRSILICKLWPSLFSPSLPVPPFRYQTFLTRTGATFALISFFLQYLGIWAAITSSNCKGTLTCTFSYTVVTILGWYKHVEEPSCSSTVVKNFSCIFVRSSRCQAAYSLVDLGQEHALQRIELRGHLLGEVLQIGWFNDLKALSNTP